MVSSLVGTVFSSGAFSTVPLIVITTGELEPFEVTVTVFVKGPTRVVLYFTFITPLPLLAIGSFGQSGTVQPQEAWQLLIISGVFPVFLNLNS